MVIPSLSGDDAFQYADGYGRGMWMKEHKDKQGADALSAILKAATKLIVEGKAMGVESALRQSRFVSKEELDKPFTI